MAPVILSTSSASSSGGRRSITARRNLAAFGPFKRTVSPAVFFASTSTGLRFGPPPEEVARAITSRATFVVAYCIGGLTHFGHAARCRCFGSGTGAPPLRTSSGHVHAVILRPSAPSWRPRQLSCSPRGEARASRRRRGFGVPGRRVSARPSGFPSSGRSSRELGRR